MSDIGFSTSPIILRTHSLGSCVGIILFDPHTKNGGLIHAMLPSSTHEDTNPGKSVSTSIPFLIDLFIKAGTNPSHLLSMVFGGSHMFLSSPIQSIGKRNIFECTSLLHDLSIPILVQNTGGRIARSIELNTQTGEVVMKVKEVQTVFLFK